MNILALAPESPATPDMAGSPRMFYLCRELSRQHRIHLATVCQSLDRFDEFQRHPDTRRIFAEIVTLPPPPVATWRHKQNHRLHLGSHLCTRYSHPTYHADVRTRIARMVKSLPRPRLVYVDRLEMTQYLCRDRHTRALVDLHDSPSFIYSQQIAREKRLSAQLVLRHEQWALSRWERALDSFVDLVVVNSRVDEYFLRSVAPDLSTLTITNGVDTSYYQWGNTPVSPRRLVFIGVMAYGPNEDAVRYFSSAVLPKIKASFPDTEFWAVGANPPAALRSLSANGDVVVTGTVEDVRPYLRAASVFVCPLRYGTGIKNKLLSAMAVGVPIVCTSVAVSGIDVRPEQDVLVADTPVEFANQVGRLLTEPEFASRLARNAYARVIERYSWATHARQLDEAIQRLTGESGGYHPSLL
jgi:glycosyltransferase involved in cell wall biosynthesis